MICIATPMLIEFLRSYISLYNALCVEKKSGTFNFFWVRLVTFNKKCQVNMILFSYKKELLTSFTMFAFGKVSLRRSKLRS